MGRDNDFGKSVEAVAKGVLAGLGVKVSSTSGNRIGGFVGRVERGGESGHVHFGKVVLGDVEKSAARWTLMPRKKAKVLELDDDEHQAYQLTGGGGWGPRRGSHHFAAHPTPQGSP